MDIRDFTLAALAGLQFQWVLEENNVYTLTIPARYQEHFSHRKRMKFTFAREVADDYHDVELAVQGSYLTQILTKLVLENSPIIVEYIKIHPDFTEPDLKGSGRVSLHLENKLQFYRPLYEFRLRLECASDEMLLEFFSVIINHQGKIIAQDPAKLNQWPSLPAPETGITANSQLLQPDFIKELYLKAGQYVLELVKHKIAGFERESNNRLIIDLDKLNIYRSQGNSNDPDKAIQVEGLRDKYSVKVNIEPAGLIIKFFPFLHSKYRLSKGGKDTDLVLNHHARLYSGKENPYPCPSCGQPTRMIEICDEDHHVICDLCAQFCQKCDNSGCCEHPLTVCPVCNTKICQECRDQCAECHQFFCHEHRNQCEECAATLCPEHIYECASTHRRLCSSHAKQCFSCGQYYQLTLVKQCEHPGCQNHSCHECEHQCTACGLAVCREHTLICEDTQECRCPDHGFQCQVCKGYYGIETQSICQICHQTVCHRHTATCSNCNMAVCVNHAHQCTTTGLILCENHAKQCGVCSQWHSDHLIQSCRECGMALCPSCLKNCANGHTVCPDHIHSCTISSQAICSSCATKCRIHGHLVNKKLANICVICQGVACTGHSIHCIVCGEDACIEHSGVCGECRKNACNHHLKQCVICGRTYCSDCVNQNGWCGMCNSLVKRDYPGNSKLHSLLATIPLIERLVAIDYRYSANPNFQILSFQRMSIHIYVFDSRGNQLLKKSMKRDDVRWRGRTN
jgi:hypothetical protein